MAEARRLQKEQETCLKKIQDGLSDLEGFKAKAMAASNAEARHACMHVTAMLCHQAAAGSSFDAPGSVLSMAFGHALPLWDWQQLCI